ncbi:MAG: DUF1566 domain-containing protein [Saccharospirillaceae bacterium]|nr:DUF1566 domain-containing protein [Pseudomonadales bacterium]NRB77427.1 DUF1566 domain-containing protein [Saccharospirillaceae bacterium]
MQRIFISCLLFCYFNIAWAHSCNELSKNTAPTDRFEIMNDGVVIDKATGLMWSRCALGQSWDGVQCLNYETSFFYLEAVEQIELLTLAGFDSWRMPNVKELSSIVDRNCREPSVNFEIFPGMHSRPYWTSTKSNNYNIYGIDMANGNFYPMSEIYQSPTLFVRDHTQ